MATRKEQITKAFGDSLREFGYTNLTDKEVEDATRKALSDEPHLDIIAMFIRDWLDTEFARLRPECERLFK